MKTLKLMTIGNSVGLILPKDILERLHLDKGDQLYLTEEAEGIHLTPFNPEFAIQVEAAERVMREDRDALRKLGQ